MSGREPAGGAPGGAENIRFRSGGTTVHDQGIYVVIRWHGFLVAFRWLRGATFTDKLSYRTEPAYPPRAGPCAAPALPPGGGRTLPCSVAFSPTSPFAFAGLLGF